MPFDNIVFWVFAPISIASAVGMLLMRNAVHAALFLIVNFFCLAVFYLLLDAPFLFAVQIIVYAGAIMVLFLFVIMLLGVDSGLDVRERLAGQRIIAIVLAVGFVAEMFVAVRAGIGFATKAPDGFDAVNAGGNAQAVADGAVPRLLLPVRGHVDPADRRGDRGDGAGPPGDARRDAGRARRPRGRGRRRRARRGRLVRTPIAYFVFLSGILFALGSVGVLLRKNALIIFMSVELQLNAVNLALVAFSRMHNDLTGQVLAFFSMVVAAAEVVVGLAIIVAIYRRRRSVDVDDARELRW